MGMFTWVEPARELLPPEHWHRTGWQTKDVVDCHLETLEIMPDGDLVYVWWEREWRDDPEAFFGGYLHRTVEHRDKLDYHGDMVFYVDTENDPNSFEWSLIELVARFTDGKLEYIKSLPLPEPAA